MLIWMILVVNFAALVYTQGFLFALLRLCHKHPIGKPAK
jgi:hypothetical protein